MAFARQIWTLTKKNLLVALVRRPLSTVLSAFLLPIIVVALLTFVRNLIIPPSYFGIATPTPVRSLEDAVNAASAGRDTLAFVDGGFVGGDIERVIERVAEPVRRAGKKVRVLESADELLDGCPTSINGISNCFGAVVFHSSPDEGPGGMWNYTLRADAALGYRIDTRKTDNEVQIYAIPLQHAVDFAIASLSDTVDDAALPSEVREYMFTSKTREQRAIDLRKTYMNAIIDVLGVAFLGGLIFVVYHLVGQAASERELGMSSLIEAMMPNASRWQPQAARLISYHLAFDMIYGPGWIGVGVALCGVFRRTNNAIVILHVVLSGLAMTSFAVYGAAYFKKAQLSGALVTIAAVVLGIIAQTVTDGSTAGVVILALIFPPMNYVFFLVFLARFERLDRPADLLKSAPESPWSLPGLLLWVFLLIQIFVYPLLGALVERSRFAAASRGRKLTPQQHDAAPPVRLRNFTKHYGPSALVRFVASLRRAPAETVVAVNDLTLDVPKGQILVLLGANGSGKTTTLDAIAGLSTVTQGSVEVVGRGGLGLCPQKNVLWDDLTVREHISIFNGLKSDKRSAAKEEIRQLAAACDLSSKIKAKTSTLSGGQKRKVQLAMMFTGGSLVCCIDEVSSGLDPLSRRKVWDILLRERGSRTIVLTTHFLDEADVLADRIAILSTGSLRAEGPAVELKSKLGDGYRVHVSNSSAVDLARVDVPVSSTVDHDKAVYVVGTSAEAARLVDQLERQGIQDYRVAGPSIEDVFLKLADEVNETGVGSAPVAKADGGSGTFVDDKGSPSNSREVSLLPGKRIGMPRQAWIMFRKRLTILKRNNLPYVAAFVLPIVAGGLITLFLRDFRQPVCNAADELEASATTSFGSQLLDRDGLNLTIGPSSLLSGDAPSSFQGVVSSSASEVASVPELLQSVHQVDTLPAFNDYISEEFSRVIPGGAFAASDGAPPTFAYRGDGSRSNNGGLYNSILTQNVFDRLITNVSINTQFSAFDRAIPASIEESLRAIAYFGLAMALFPAFFALYPTTERLRNIRALHYSNGVRSLPLWLAYLSFDFFFILVTSAIVTVVFAVSSDIWYNLGYLFVVLVLYGLASAVLAYLLSLIARSQLRAFVYAAIGQEAFFLIYLISFMSVQVFAPRESVESYTNIVHFAISAISPISSLLRALSVAVNLFYINCRDKKLISYPGEIVLYGGPILYLTLQTIILFAALLWFEGGPKRSVFPSRSRAKDEEEKQSQDKEIADELQRARNTSNALRVLHVTKAFKSNVAVEDVTFAVSRGEVFALLGPNGAGKSTTVSMIRGDIQPNNREGEIFIENSSIRSQRATARSHMGVCPQFDAMDQMTTLEHLRFYARIRGVADVEHNVREVVRAVGLESVTTRLAGKLSGGNQRKLSLAIALLGNPTVLLLDEPSSGMDAASKRVMWKTLASVVPNRSILLTTHSMEEADALAHRAGIMATRMLALGTTDHLRKKYGDAYYVHLITHTAPHTSAEEMERIKSWILQHFSHAVIEPNSYHGQIRFGIPAKSPSVDSSSNASAVKTADAEDTIEAGEPSDPNQQFPMSASPTSTAKKSSVSALFNLLEANKSALGLEHYSVSQTTLDQVFLTIIGRHNVQEEGDPAETKAQKKKERRGLGWFTMPSIPLI